MLEREREKMTALLTETTHNLTTRLHEELLRQEANELNQQQAARRHLLRPIVWGYDALAGIALSSCRWIHETLDSEGFEGRELVGYCGAVLVGIEGSLKGYERLLALAAASDLTPEALGLRDLETKLPLLREAHSKVAELLALANRQPVPLDEEVLAESRAAIQRGESVIIDDESLGRVQAGEAF